MTTAVAGTTGKKRKLVKESKLVSSRKETLSSLTSRKSSSDKASKGKGKESSSQGAGGNLLVALIPNESGVHFWAFSKSN